MAIASGLTACGGPPQDVVRHNRVNLAASNFRGGEDIRLAVVWNKANGEFLSGAVLAAEEINAEGGVAGRRLKLEFTDEAPFLERNSVQRSVAEGRYRNALQEAGTDMARAVLANPNVAAVIGHPNSEATLSAMLSYQANGVLFFSGGSTDSRILWSSDDFYVQILPQDRALAKAMSAALVKRRWDDVFIVYVAERHNEELVELLKAEFSGSGVRFAGSAVIMSDERDSVAGARRLQSALSEIRDGTVDAIVIIASPVLGAQVIRQSRNLGMLLPFVGTRAMATPEFLNIVGDAGVDMLITSLRSEGYQLRRFAARFKKRFPGAVVDESAAIGYDCVRLYATAVESANSTDPTQIELALHYKLPIWYGLLGSYIFKNRTNTGFGYYIRKLVRGKSGSLEFVPADNPA